MSEKNRNKYNCFLCGANLEKTLLEITKPDRFEQFVGVRANNYQRFWMECPNCGAANNILDQDVREKLEELSASYYEVDLPGEDIPNKFQKIMSLPPKASDNAGRVLRITNFLQNWYDSLKNNDLRSRKAMDIGAGIGVFLSRFLSEVNKPNKTWSALAVEPDPNAAQHLRSLDQFEVFEGVFKGQLNLGDFDLVTLNKIIEHVENPIHLLKDITSVLNSNSGLAYIEVPDKLTIGNRVDTDNILGALHYHLYDPLSLSMLLSNSGLHPIQINRIVEPSGKITIYAFACLETALNNYVN